MPVKRKDRDVPAWANQVRHLRRLTGKTLADFAALFEVSNPAVAQWESGRTRPSSDKWLRMAVIAATYDRQLSKAFAEYARPLLADAGKLLGQFAAPETDWIEVPILRDAAYLSLASAAPKAETLGSLAIPRWIAPPKSHSRLFAFEINDNSMSPLMFSGDVAIAMRMAMDETDAPLPDRSLVAALNPHKGLAVRRLHKDAGMDYLRDERETKVKLAGPKWRVVALIICSLRRWA